MKTSARNLIIVIVILAVLVLAVSSVVFGARVYLFQETLQSSNTRWQGEGSGWGVVTLNSTGGQNIAMFEFLVGQTLENRSYSIPIPLEISVPHTQGSHLDSLELNFLSSSGAPNVWLGVPGGYPWNPVKLNQPNSDQETFSIPNLGFQGTGTVTLPFMLQAPYNNTANYSFAIQVQMTLHNTNESLTSFLGQKYTVLFTIPFTIEPNSTVVLSEQTTF